MFRNIKDAMGLAIGLSLGFAIVRFVNKEMREKLKKYQ